MANRSRHIVGGGLGTLRKQAQADYTRRQRNAAYRHALIVESIASATTAQHVRTILHAEG